MQEAAADPKDPHGRNVPIRMGWAAAPLWPASSARKKSSTVWGDAVNAASRMESTGADSKIQVSQDVHACLKDAFVLKERGEIDVKGKGIMRTGSWWGERPLPTVHQQHAQGLSEPSKPAPIRLAHPWRLGPKEVL